MSAMTASNRTAPTQFLEANGEKYAYRRFGEGPECPILFLQHFEHLPNAMLLTYPDSGHGSLFQHHESFVRQTSLFLE